MDPVIDLLQTHIPIANLRLDIDGQTKILLWDRMKRTWIVITRDKDDIKPSFRTPFIQEALKEMTRHKNNKATVNP